MNQWPRAQAPAVSAHGTCRVRSLWQCHSLGRHATVCLLFFKLAHPTEPTWLSTAAALCNPPRRPRCTLHCCPVQPASFPRASRLQLVTSSTWCLASPAPALLSFSFVVFTTGFCALFVPPPPAVVLALPLVGAALCGPSVPAPRSADTHFLRGRYDR